MLSVIMLNVVLLSVTAPYYKLCTAVEHLPHHPKVKGSSSAAASGIGRENGKSESTHANMQ